MLPRLREDNCPFCLSILTIITETTKPGNYSFHCHFCNTRLFIRAEKIIQEISNNYLAIKGQYKTDHIKELLQAETPPLDLSMKCPFCQGEITIKQCKKKEKEKDEKNNKPKEPTFYFICKRGCGCGFIPQKAMELWKKTTSLLTFIQA